MLHHRSNSGSKVWEEWHEERERARHTAMSVNEFSDQEIEKYDLDTARIDGQENPETYTTEPYASNEEPADIRDDPQN